MVKRFVFPAILAALLAAPSVIAQDENPTIAFLRYGSSSLISLSEKGIMDMLQAYGFVDGEECAILDESGDLDGERINVIYRDAGFDLATANIMIENALDHEADIPLTLSTPVTQLAANITREIDPRGLIDATKEDPPRVLLAGFGGLNQNAPQQERAITLDVSGAEGRLTDLLAELVQAFIDQGTVQVT